MKKTALLTAFILALAVTLSACDADRAAPVTTPTSTPAAPPAAPDSAAPAPDPVPDPAPDVWEWPDIGKTGYTLDAETLARSLVSTGDVSRFVKAFEKAAKGEPVAVAFIGGSITEGFYAEPQAAACYAALTVDWMREKFNNPGITLINAGESGTPSMYGVMRVEPQVLVHSPDIVFIEFAVNDGGEDDAIAFESLIRKALKSESQPAVGLLFMADDKGRSRQEDQVLTGGHYDLPMVSVGDSVSVEIEQERLTAEDFFQDSLHPNTSGHAYTAELMKYCLEAIYEKVRNFTGGAYIIPEETRLANTYEAVIPLNRLNFEPLDAGSFTLDTSDTKPLLADGWKRPEGAENEPFVFELTARQVYVTVWSTPGYGGPAGGVAEVTVNGESVPDINASRGWGDPRLRELVRLGEPEELRIEIKMAPEMEDRPFWILGINYLP